MPLRMKVTDEDQVIDFGKYRGKTIDYIMEHNPSYIIWLADEGIVEFDAGILDCAQLMDNENSIPESVFFMED